MNIDHLEARVHIDDAAGDSERATAVGPSAGTTPPGPPTAGSRAALKELLRPILRELLSEEAAEQRRVRGW